MITRRAALALTVLLSANAGLAQKQSPPPPAPPKDFAAPAATKFRLDNGLEVTLVPYGTVPKVRVELAVLAGNAYDGAKQVSLADLTGSLMREGTTTKTATQISQAAARMGGSLDVEVSVNAAEISGDVLSESGPEMVRLVADVVRNPKFPESELPRLKADSLRQLSITRSQPQQMALEKFRGTLYPDHPYGRIFPTPEMVQGFTLADVRSFYDANYGASRAHLYVAGKFDRSAMEAAIREAFGGWKAGKPSALAAPKPKSARAIYLVDRPGAVQSTILLGMPVPDPSNPDYVPLSVVNTLLAAPEDVDRTVDCARLGVGRDMLAPGDEGGGEEAADVTTNVTGPSLKEIFYEIDRLQAEPPSAAELKATQNYIAGVFVLQNSSRSGIINVLELVDLHGLPADYLKTFVKRVYAVTPQDVQRLAQKYIQDDKATIVVVGDRKVIEEQIKPYGTIVP